MKLPDISTHDGRRAWAFAAITGGCIIFTLFAAFGVWALRDIMTPDGRRAWAFAAITGGCIIFTLFAAFGVWALRDIPGFTFWLALAAHVQVFLGMGALGWAMGRRMVSEVSRDGAKFDDREGGE